MGIRQNSIEFFYEGLYKARPLLWILFASQPLVSYPKISKREKSEEPPLLLDNDFFKIIGHEHVAVKSGAGLSGVVVLARGKGLVLGMIEYQIGNA